MTTERMSGAEYESTLAGANAPSADEPAPEPVAEVAPEAEQPVEVPAEPETPPSA